MNVDQNALNALSSAAKTCRECGGLFQPARAWQAFCADRCRSEFHRKKALGPDGRLRELEATIAAMASHIETLQKRLALLEATSRA